jgi:Fe-S-cluster formation regulator IscX/YfhJ
VTLFVTLPPAPVHDIENVSCATRLLDASLPLVALPVENPAPPVAVHDVAFVDVHVSVVGLPEVTGFGDAVRVAVGADAAATSTVTLFVTEPPAPVHDIENVVCDVRLLDASLPPVALPVENPAPPVAVHDVAFVDVHVSVVGLPEFTGFGDAVSVAVGAGAA